MFRLSCLSLWCVCLLSAGVLNAVAAPVPAIAQAAGGRAFALPSTGREAVQRVRGRLGFALEEQGLTLGAPLYLRVIKNQSVLEAWVQRRRGGWQRFRAYKLCGGRSADLGPRTGAQGLPEGFYAVGRSGLRAPGAVYLGLDFGWPNALDRARGWTQGDILLQGTCARGGHVALTDQDMEEVYALTHAALVAGQSEVALHVFPFAMTGLNMARRRGSPHATFWAMLEPAWTVFERTKTPPQTQVQGRRYRVRSGSGPTGSGQR